MRRTPELIIACLIGMAGATGALMVHLLPVEANEGGGEPKAAEPKKPSPSHGKSGSDSAHSPRHKVEADEPEEEFSQHTGERCIADAAAIEDIRKAREVNALKAKELASQEAELNVREKNLTEQLKKLEVIREDISKVRAVKKEETETKIQQLTDVLLTMNPKAAAKMLGTLEEDLAIEIMLKLDTQRLSKYLGLMDPAMSSRLSEKMVGVSRKGGKVGVEPSSASRVAGNSSK